MRIAAGLLVVLCASCAGPSREAAPVGAVSPETAATQVHAELAPPDAGPPAPPPLRRDVVERAALPYHGLKGGHELSPKQLMRALSQAEVVCVGERHDNPHDHYAELEILRSLARRAPAQGRELGLGLEMVQASDQSALDDYVNGQSTATEFVQNVDWSNSWGFDFSYYRPLLVVARRRGLDVLALSPSEKLVHKVATSGLKGLTHAERKKLPELELHNTAYRAYFRQAMQGHPPSAGSFDHLYAAQVLRDESMASRAAKWISANLPARQLIIVAGRGHCIRSAIVGRVLRRVHSAHVVNVEPLLEPSDGDPKAALARYDYGFVMTRDP